MNRKISTLNIKALYTNTGGLCSIGSCRRSVILHNAAGVPIGQIGKIAHIIAYSPTGPRGDDTLDRKNISEYENLILLCPTCHDTVDACTDQYTVEYLKEAKRIHEQWFYDKLHVSIPKVWSPELIMAIEAIATGEYDSSDDINIVPVIDKIARNNFTNSVSALINMGLKRSAEVRSFFKRQEQVDQHYVERLKNSFKAEYYKQK